jgi:hypothetical protein
LRAEGIHIGIIIRKPAESGLWKPPLQAAGYKEKPK